MPALPDASALAPLPLFQQLRPEQLERLNALLRRTSFPADAPVMTIGQPGEVAYIILSGTVKIHAEQADGRDVVVALRGPGEVVGEMSLLDDAARSASVVTLEPCVMLWIDRAAFQLCLEEIPAISLNLVHILARRLRVATSQVQVLSTQDLYGRVAHLLTTLADEYDVAEPDGSIKIPLRLTQSDLASLAGASRARVNQALGLYRDQQLIILDQESRIRIVDREALAARFA
jgi:CRP/FNR family transcriptional regulator, cyclic AMP receptor protein